MPARFGSHPGNAIRDIRQYYGALGDYDTPRKQNEQTTDSSWSADDILKNWAIPGAKVITIPPGCYILSNEELRRYIEAELVPPFAMKLLLGHRPHNQRLP